MPAERGDLSATNVDLAIEVRFVVGDAASQFLGVLNNLARVATVIIFINLS